MCATAGPATAVGSAIAWPVIVVVVIAIRISAVEERRAEAIPYKRAAIVAKASVAAMSVSAMSVSAMTTAAMTTAAVSSAAAYFGHLGCFARDVGNASIAYTTCSRRGRGATYAHDQSPGSQ